MANDNLVGRQLSRYRLISQHAHQQGFIHGQVMPRNILLRQNNEVVLDHFDFSRLSDNMGTLLRNVSFEELYY
jgi:serine/threonine protein kinase